MIIYGIIAVLLLILVTFLIRAEIKENIGQIYVLKPLSSLLLILIAVIAYIMGIGDRTYILLVLLGIVFCFGGDVALMFQPKSAFLAGLISFLIGHVVYAGVFTYYNQSWVQNYLVAGVLIVLGALFYAYLYSGLTGMKVPVLVYLVVISFMLNSAVTAFYSEFFNVFQAAAVAIGAGLFYISDIILAINRFKKPLRYNRFSLAFYYSGQFLIAASTVM
jgi:uncharacterized membrane protein YhhN